MLFNRNFRTLLCLIALMGSCKSAEIAGHKEISSQDASLENIRKIYSPYESLKGDFILKGQVSGNAFTYNGKINLEKIDNSKKIKMTMVVRDMIFLSPIISIMINNDELKWIDHFNNQEKKYDYGKSSILFFSDQKVPADILISMLTGNLPGDMLEYGKSNAKNSSIKYSNDAYEVVGFFSDSKLNTLICNPSEDYNQVVYKITGTLKNTKSRYFPETIKIILGNNNFIEITYNKIALN